LSSSQTKGIAPANLLFQDYIMKREEWAELKPKMPFLQVPVLEVGRSRTKMKWRHAWLCTESRWQSGMMRLRCSWSRSLTSALGLILFWVRVSWQFVVRNDSWS